MPPCHLALQDSAECPQHAQRLNHRFRLLRLLVPCTPTPHPAQPPHPPTAIKCARRAHPNAEPSLSVEQKALPCLTDNTSAQAVAVGLGLGLGVGFICLFSFARVIRATLVRFMAGAVFRPLARIWRTRMRPMAVPPPQLPAPQPPPSPLQQPVTVPASWWVAHKNDQQAALQLPRCIVSPTAMPTAAPPVVVVASSGLAARLFLRWGRSYGVATGGSGNGFSKISPEPFGAASAGFDGPPILRLREALQRKLAAASPNSTGADQARAARHPRGCFFIVFKP